MPSKKPDTRKGDRSKTTARTFRISDDLYEAVLAKARKADSTATPSDAIRLALVEYVGDPSITGLAGSDMDRRSGAARVSD
jgi:hypothetical protein